jgi:hypothetical protein
MGKPSRTAQKRQRNHRGVKVLPQTWDGVPDIEIYLRDVWRCQMPECLCPAGRPIDPRLQGTESDWAPSIDHVVPLRDGGPDTAGNKRAAHRYCNNVDMNTRNKPIGPLSIASRLDPELLAQLLGKEQS